MEEKSKMIVIDARPKEAYENEHIPRAISLHHQIMDETSTAHLDKEILYVTCDGIGCNSSSTTVPINTVDYESIDANIDEGLRIIFDNIPEEDDYYVISHFQIDQQFGFIYNDELLQLIHGKDVLGDRLITRRVILRSGIYLIGHTDYNYY